MLFKGTLIGAASGSVAGVTFARNRGGQYTRQRSTPTQPNTPRQVEVRDRFATCSQAWRALAQALRDQWNAIAPTVTLLNALGDPISYTGHQLFVAVNTLRLNAGLSIRSIGPTESGKATLQATTFTFTAGGPDFEVAYGAGTWTAAGGAMLVQVGGPKSAGVSFFKGPFSQAGVVLGAAVAPVSPALFSYLVDFLAGQKYWARVIATDEDGRLSDSAVLQGVEV